MALDTIELEGVTLPFAWPDTLDMLPRKYRLKLSDFGIQSVEGALAAARRKPEGKEAKALRVLQTTMIALMGRTWQQDGRPKKIAGETVVKEWEESRNGRKVKRSKVETEERTRFGLKASEVVTRAKHGVTGVPGQWKKFVGEWEKFTDLAPRLKFLDDLPNPGVPLGANDLEEFKRLHSLAQSETDEIRRESLDLVAKIAKGDYEEEWDGEI